MFNTPLKGAPEAVLERGPSVTLRALATYYQTTRGLSTAGTPRDYIRVDPKVGRARAKAFDDAVDKAYDGPTKVAYEVLCRESLMQYRLLRAAGLKVYFQDTTKPIPHPLEVMDDVRVRNEIAILSTADGFGDGAFPSAATNPLLKQSGERTDGGEPMLYNDIFRVVHDVFGHVKEGLGFGPDGEDNAYRQHRSMYSKVAQVALATETRGQNSWVNYGPHGQHNQEATPEATIYAEQKVCILPSWLVLVD